MESIFKTLVAFTLGWLIGQLTYLALMGWTEGAIWAATLLNVAGAWAAIIASVTIIINTRRHTGR